MAQTNYKQVLQDMIYEYENQCDSIVSQIERLEQALAYIRNEESKTNIASLLTEYEKTKELLERLIGFLDDSKIQIKEYEENLRVTNEYMRSLRL